MKKSRAFSAADSQLHLLHRASQRADEMFAKSVDVEGLTARQLVVLAIVADTSDPSQTVIGEKSGIDRSTLADIVARLVSRGLLSRKRTRLDGRKYAVRLTESGRKALEQGISAAQKVDQTLTVDLTADQRTALDLALNRMISGSTD